MTTSAAVSLGYVAVYVALVGVASFVEKPAGRGFGAFQLNALIRAGSLAAAAVRGTRVAAVNLGRHDMMRRLLGQETAARSSWPGPTGG